MLVRCAWADQSLSEQHYHDHEWGYRFIRTQNLFEFLILEGAQAGLRWSTILNKRHDFRIAFDQFSVEHVAHYDKAKMMNCSAIPRSYVIG